MSIKFCLVSAQWQSPSLSCRLQAAFPPDGSYPKRVRELASREGEIKESTLIALRQKYLSLNLQDNSNLTKLAIAILAADPHIISFNFIPKNPAQLQVVYGYRVRDDFPPIVYEHYRGLCRFYLPVKDYPEDRIFSLRTVVPSLEKLTLDRHLAKAALMSVALNSSMLGIAITVKEGTFIWLKG